MTAAALIRSLRARGIHLRGVGDRIRYGPASALTPEDLEALRQHKVEVLVLLSQEPGATEPATTLALDPITVRKVLGDHPDEHDLGCLRIDVLAVVRQLEAEIARGAIDQRVRTIRGRPLCDWLPLDAIARLLRGRSR